MPIGLILSLIWKLPSLLRTGMAILKLLSTMKGKSLPEVVDAVVEILKLILEIAPTDKPKAAVLMNELHDALKIHDPETGGTERTLERLIHLKRRCSGVGCAPDTKA